MKKQHICNCGQTSFVPLNKFGKKKLCNHCYIKAKENAQKIIKVEFPQLGGDDILYLPLQENLENGYETFENFDELQKDWSSKTWDYSHNPIVTLTTVEENPDIFEKVDLEKISQCDEFDVYFFDDLGIFPDMYDSPFDETPSEYKFCGYHAMDCYQGKIYSKDFAWFYCEDCERYICEQNPSNGWHVQYRLVDEAFQVCLKCYEQDILKNGVDLEKVKNDEIPGMFLNDLDLKENGFNPDQLFQDVKVIDSKEACKRILKLSKKNLVVVNYEHMAIDGLEGYISIWYKKKEKREN